MFCVFFFLNLFTLWPKYFAFLGFHYATVFISPNASLLCVTQLLLFSCMFCVHLIFRRWEPHWSSHPAEFSAWVVSCPTHAQTLFLCAPLMGTPISDLFASLWIQLHCLENHAKAWARAMYHWFFMLHSTCLGQLYPIQDATAQKKPSQGWGAIINQGIKLGLYIQHQTAFGSCLFIPSSRAVLEAMSSSSQCHNSQPLPWFSCYQKSAPWAAMALADTELEYAQQMTINVSSRHLREHRGVRCARGQGQLLSPALFSSRTMSGISSCHQSHCLFWDWSDAALSLLLFYLITLIS